jgi:hypothetical protein
MDWKDIASTVGKAAPLLGTLLGGRAGAAVGALIASSLGTGSDPADVAQVLATNPEALLKLKQIEADRQVKLQELLIDQSKADIAGQVQASADVNKTMQAEAAAEHWPTYGWRPAIGFAVALAVVLAVLTVFAAYAAAIIYNRPEGLAQLPGILAAIAGIIAVVSPILGIASWYRGKMQADPAVPTVNRG